MHGLLFVQSSEQIVDKRVEDAHAATMDILGQPKCARHGERLLPQDITFGMPTMKFAEEGVEKLISGDFSCAEQSPDPDLGKSLREGWRNLAPDNKASILWFSDKIHQTSCSLEVLALQCG